MVRRTAATILAALLLALGTTLVAPPAASAATDTLAANQTLRAGQSLKSANGLYTALMRADGNFVVRKTGGAVIWSAGTAVASSTITMQSDGNLVIYKPVGGAVWSSGTAPSSNDRLVMQSDGNLVLYSRGGLPLWASRGGRTNLSQSTLPAGATLGVGQALWSSDGRFTAVMQSDGNFVVYQNGGGGAIWASATGVAGSTIAMQSDGNLVIYKPVGGAAWSSGTAVSSFDNLVMQSDGNLVLYSRGGLPLWASRGGRTNMSENTLGTGGTLAAGQALWSPDGRFTALMQGDGNFVVYLAGGVPQWASGTGVAGSSVTMQSDGNLVVYAPGMRAVWSSSTAPSSNDSLVMQNDGNLVVYSTNGAVWASKGAPAGGTGSDGYPDSNAVDCSAQFGIYSWCESGTDMSSRGFGYRNCTDYVAWRLGLVWSQVQAGNDGNARAWKQGWINRGKSWGTAARVGAIAWWSGTSRGHGFGHVAVVVGVNQDGSALVAQYNQAGTGVYSTSVERAEAYLY